MSILTVDHINKSYQAKAFSRRTEVLKDLSFEVEPGEFIAIMGESGAGKTTLLNLLAGLDRQDSGTIKVGEQDFAALKDEGLAEFRRNRLGFVFQDFNLLNSFSIKDNILLPLVLKGEKLPEMKHQLRQVAKFLNMEHLLEKFPAEVSGGQKQKAAVARALINDPELILADEPTGALDSKNAEMLMEVFEKLHENGQTILMVTHSMKAASHASRILFIKDGKIFHQLIRGDQDPADFMEKISNTLLLLEHNV